MRKNDYPITILPDIEMYGGDTEPWKVLIAHEDGTSYLYSEVSGYSATLSFVQKIGAQFASYIIALIILVVAQLATGTMTWQLVALDIFNAAVVSFASNGVYDATATAVASLAKK